MENYMKDTVGGNAISDNFGNLLLGDSEFGIIACSKNGDLIQMVDGDDNMAFITSFLKLTEASWENNQVSLGDVQSPLQFICSENERSAQR